MTERETGTYVGISLTDGDQDENCCAWALGGSVSLRFSAFVNCVGSVSLHFAAFNSDSFEDCRLTPLQENLLSSFVVIVVVHICRHADCCI